MLFILLLVEKTLSFGDDDDDPKPDNKAKDDGVFDVSSEAEDFDAEDDAWSDDDGDDWKDDGWKDSGEDS